jgi:hypothetical protein
MVPVFLNFLFHWIYLPRLDVEILLGDLPPNSPLSANKKVRFNYMEKH